MLRSRFGLFCWAILALWLPASSFGLVVKMDLPQLIRASDLIVQGQVLETRSQWIRDASGNNIWTFVTVKGGVPFKGTSGDGTFTLRVMGGTVDGVTQEVSDTPVFSVGDEAFLFLRSSPLRVVGGFQGWKSVQEGKVTGILDRGVSLEVFADALKTYLKDGSADLYALLVDPPPSAKAGGSVPAEVARHIQASKPADAGQRAQVPTASIVFIYWDKQVDYDGDGFNQFGELYWDADVKGGSGTLTVYEKVYWRLSSSSTWTPLIDTPVHTITGSASSDAQYLKLNGGTHDRYDFRVEIYQQGAATPDDTADPSAGDDALSAYPMETPDQDAAGSGPVVIDMEPGEASAGTGMEIFIRGLGLGATQGSGNIKFFVESGETIQVPKGGVTKWTDTAIQCKAPIGTVGGYPHSAGSGPVTVTSADGVPVEYDPYIISFGYGGRKWGGTNPKVDYYVGSNMPPDWVEAVQNAANTWSGGGLITFEKVGTTTNVDLTANGKTEIMYGVINDDTVIGYATCYSGADVSECDLVLNSKMNFSTTSTTPNGYFDVWTICLHEMGHWLTLRDLYGNAHDGFNDSGKVMYGWGDTGTRGQRRSLSTADADGVAWIYGAASAPHADFTWFTGYPAIGQPVAFVDESTLAPSAWLWDFGDGYTSTEQNPTHAYSFSGTYSVTLTATNAYGSGSGSKSIIIAGSGIVPPVTAPQTYTYVIPATAKATGAGNTNWLSDMTIFNPSSAAAGIYSYFLETGLNNTAAPGVEAAVGGTKFIKIGDLVAHMFRRTGTSGALLLTCAQPLQIASRTYNDQGEVKGTYGQFIPAFAADRVLLTGEEGILLHLSRTARSRSNIGGVNLSNLPLDLNISAYDANNTLLGTKAYTLQPYEHFQTNGFLDQFTTQPVQDAYAVATATTGDARYLVYASIVDNTTGDPIFIPPQKVQDVQGQTHQLIATVARAKGGYGSNWKTDARFYNPFAAQTAALTLVTGAGSFTGSLSLAAGQLIPSNDVITALFPAVTGDTAGSLHIQSAQGLMITSRTFNDQGAAGTYGQFIPARTSAGVIPSGEAWQLLQLASNSAFRCNVGFSDFGGGGAQVQVKLYDSNRSILGFKSYTVSPSGNTQINDIFADMGLSTPQDAAMADIRVASGGPIYAYASVVDNRSNDAIFIPAQK